MGVIILKNLQNLHTIVVPYSPAVSLFALLERLQARIFRVSAISQPAEAYNEDLSESNRVLAQRRRELPPDLLSMLASYSKFHFCF